MGIQYLCEFCGMKIADEAAPGSQIVKGGKTDTDEGGEIHHCEMQVCLDKIDARKTVIDDSISNEKSKEAARLQDEYGGLKTELDKAAYSGKTDLQKLDILNDPTQGTPEDNPLVSADDFKEAMDPVEFAALTQDEKSSLSVFTAGGYIDLEGKNTKATLDIIFPAESKSRIAIEALRVIPKSVAENMGQAVFKQEHLERAGLI